MTKQKIVWSCAECGHNQYKWSGQCPQCSQWNTLQEEIEVSLKTKRFCDKAQETSRPVRLKEVSLVEKPRFQTEFIEFDRLLGGGIVVGSLTLVGGEPGIGKSTILLQVASLLAKQGHLVLYVCGEESVSQTSMRARRLGIDSDNLLLLSETNYSLIQAQVDALNPSILIIDSIQIIYKPEIPSAPGSVSQVRECTAELMHLAKGRGISTFLIGHVTKSGEIAGPRILEHLVDTVLYFEGDKQNQFRMMRVVKNRFGPTDDIAVFQMGTKGLTEVHNPSEIFLEERKRGSSGSVIVPTIEGSRPILIEVQALVSHTVFTSPSRRSAGLDQNRMALLLAVLEKRVGYPLHQRDVFVSIAGGIRIIEPALDLGVLLAIASSLINKAVHPEVIVVGEVGLGGEVRSVSRIEMRLKEAIHMGFTRCLIPKRNLAGISEEFHKKLVLKGVEFVEEAIDVLLPS
ncbi:MAG: DNA repair protein RadA [Chlamydiales bacterium]|nr:DNA repair protein RadA [Chlamydiales bacterium]